MIPFQDLSRCEQCGALHDDCGCGEGRIYRVAVCLVCDCEGCDSCDYGLREGLTYGQAAYAAGDD